MAVNASFFHIDAPINQLLEFFGAACVSLTEYRDKSDPNAFRQHLQDVVLNTFRQFVRRLEHNFFWNLARMRHGTPISVQLSRAIDANAYKNLVRFNQAEHRGGNHRAVSLHVNLAISLPNCFAQLFDIRHRHEGDFTAMQHDLLRIVT